MTKDETPRHTAESAAIEIFVKQIANIENGLGAILQDSGLEFTPDATKRIFDVRKKLIDISRQLGFGGIHERTKDLPGANGNSRKDLSPFALLADHEEYEFVEMMCEACDNGPCRCASQEGSPPDGCLQDRTGDAEWNKVEYNL